MPPEKHTLESLALLCDDHDEHVSKKRRNVFSPDGTRLRAKHALSKLLEELHLASPLIIKSTRFPSEGDIVSSVTLQLRDTEVWSPLYYVTRHLMGLTASERFFIDAEVNNVNYAVTDVREHSPGRHELVLHAQRGKFEKKPENPFSEPSQVPGSKQ